MKKRYKRWRFIWNIPRLVKMSWTMLKDSHVSLEKKAILILLGAGYFIWPFDLIPDFIPLPGQLDDLGVLFLLLNWFVNNSITDDSIETEYYIEDENENNNKNNNK